MFIIDGLGTKYDLNIYDIQTNQWSSETVEFGFRILSFECVVVDNDEFLIIVGGHKMVGDGWVCNDKIYVLNLKEMCLVECSIECPLKDERGGTLRGIVMSGCVDDCKLLIDGFSRGIWDKDGCISSDVMDIILMFFGNVEYLHLVNGK